MRTVTPYMWADILYNPTRQSVTAVSARQSSHRKLTSSICGRRILQLVSQTIDDRVIYILHLYHSPGLCSSTFWWWWRKLTFSLLSTDFPLLSWTPYWGSSISLSSSILVLVSWLCPQLQDREVWSTLRKRWTWKFWKYLFQCYHSVWSFPTTPLRDLCQVSILSSRAPDTIWQDSLQLCDAA